MRNNYKAVRIEIPIKLYNEFKKYTQQEYKTQTGVVREMIIKYISEKKKNNNV